MELKTKPFNLKKALHGHTVVMRDGTKIAEVIKPKDKFSKVSLIAITESGNVFTFVGGSGVIGKQALSVDSPSDLVMLDSTVTGWINVYPRQSMDLNVHCGTTVYKTRKEAKQAAKEVNREDLTQAKVSWRE